MAVPPAPPVDCPLAVTDSSVAVCPSAPALPLPPAHPRGLENTPDLLPVLLTLTARLLGPRRLCPSPLHGLAEVSPQGGPL